MRFAEMGATTRGGQGKEAEGKACRASEERWAYHACRYARARNRLQRQRRV